MQRDSAFLRLSGNTHFLDIVLGDGEQRLLGFAIGPEHRAPGQLVEQLLRLIDVVNFFGLEAKLLGDADSDLLIAFRLV